MIFHSEFTWHSVSGIHWNFANCRIAVLSGTLAAIQVSNNVGLHHLKKYPFPPSIRSISLWSSCLFVGGWFREGKKIHLVFPLYNMLPVGNQRGGYVLQDVLSSKVLHQIVKLSAVTYDALWYVCETCDLMRCNSPSSVRLDVSA